MSDWTAMSKSEAVTAALMELGGPATSSQVEEVLRGHGREGDRNITQAMSALKAKGQACNPEKGVWALVEGSTVSGSTASGGQVRAAHREATVQATKDKSEILCPFPSHFPLHPPEWYASRAEHFAWVPPRDMGECPYNHDRDAFAKAERSRARERAGEGIEG